MTKYSFQNASALTAVSNGLLNWAQTRGGRGNPANKNDRFFYQAQYDHHVKENGSIFWKKKGIELTANDKVRIVWAGSLEPTLDLRTCLNAIENFSSRNNSKIEFIFCGLGSMESSVLALQKRISNFRFVGHVGKTELRDLLAHSNFGLMCYPDRFDFHASIPNKLVDFCMAGMRVITNLDGVLNLLKSPGDALQYKAGDAFSLVEVFDMISTNQKRFMVKSRNNRLLYEKEFDASSVLPKFCEYLEDVVTRVHLSKIK
jgi:glycosyltransferase involved in cell wall biosynthesis